jgi:2-keto-4-pentenoate hydratase/2-oxohepta-3-ene-1,7-dioic acid hydratase in catechol pathway
MTKNPHSSGEKDDGLPNGYISMCAGKGYALALKTERGIFDIGTVARFVNKALPTTIEALIEDGQSDIVQDAVATYVAAGQTAGLLEERDIAFAPSVPRPEKIIVVGANYRDHLEEIGWAVPKFPLFFNKFNNSLLGHGGILELPRADTEQFDYEAELVIVIGRTTKNVTEKDALASVFGYCVGNDFSARDLQMRTSQVMLGKTSDGFAPIGPVLVPASAVPNPNDLAIECFVNGERRQSARTSKMIFSCSYLVSYISRYMTLKPGDIIFTGTPAGPILGHPENERKWLKAGDRVDTRIERLGTLGFTLA